MVKKIIIFTLLFFIIGATASAFVYMHYREARIERQNAKAQQKKITIIEGWDTKDIANYLEKQNITLYTSNFILNETLTLLFRRAGGKFAAHVANNLYSSKILQILRPDEEDEKKAIKLIDKFSDHQIGFTDCLSSVLMQKYGISDVFTFDQHFYIWKYNIIG